LERRKVRKPPASVHGGQRIGQRRQKRLRGGEQDRGGDRQRAPPDQGRHADNPQARTRHLPQTERLSQPERRDDDGEEGHGGIQNGGDGRVQMDHGVGDEDKGDGVPDGPDYKKPAPTGPEVRRLSDAPGQRGQQAAGDNEPDGHQGDGAERRAGDADEEVRCAPEGRQENQEDEVERGHGILWLCP